MRVNYIVAHMVIYIFCLKINKKLPGMHKYLIVYSQLKPG